MSVRDMAAEFGLPVAVVRGVVRDIYRAGRKRDGFTPRQVRLVRWALVMAGKLAE